MRAVQGYYRLVPIAFILMVAAFLRLTHSGLMEFKGDEAVAAMMVADALGGGEWLTHGLMSSVGIYNPPVFIYLMMIPGLFSVDPIHLAQFVGLLNVGAVFLTWWFGRKIFNERVGLMAALFFAVSPWAVIYSRKIWAQDCIPIFSLLVIGGLYELIVKEDRRWFLPAFIAAGLLPGLHFSGLFAAFLFGVFVLAFRPGVGWWRWAVGVVVMGLMYIPYLLNHASSGGIGKSMSGARMSVDAVIYAGQIMSHFGFDYLVGGQQSIYQTLGNKIIAADIAGGILIMAFVSGGCLLTKQVWTAGKRLKEEKGAIRPDAARLLCWGWLVLSVKGYLWLSLDKQIYPHYLIILYPIQFWLAAVAVDWMLERVGKSWARVAKAFVVLAASAEILFVGVFLRQVDLRGGFEGDYGVAYKHKRAIVEEMISRADGMSAAPRMIESSRDDREYRYLLLWLWQEKQTRRLMSFRVTENFGQSDTSLRRSPLKLSSP
ncbi:MAG: hypothetical protein O3B01_25965 [Planctomycetota bacterium]|nr:hypothetical protein [Planctomycetota bacterium]MDA1142023.1 hypothetical protein [Planctomycetota bacterium]